MSVKITFQKSRHNGRHCCINLNLQDYDSFVSETHNTVAIVIATLNALQ